MRLLWSSRFIRDFKGLSCQNPQLIIQVEQRLQQLSENPFDPRLHTHKLKGALSDVWACSVDYSNRILFEFVQNPESLSEEVISLLAVGSHDDVY